MATLAYETVCSSPKEAGSRDPDKHTALIVHGLLGSGYGHLPLLSGVLQYECKEYITKPLVEIALMQAELENILPHACQ